MNSFLYVFIKQVASFPDLMYIKEGKHLYDLLHVSLRSDNPAFNSIHHLSSICVFQLGSQPLLASAIALRRVSSAFDVVCVVLSFFFCFEYPKFIYI